MNRNDRRRFDKEFRKVLSTNGDCCGLCGKALEHNSKTFGGFSVNLQTVLTGECCVRRLSSIMARGVYVNKNIDAMPRGNHADKSHPISQKDAATVIESLQSHFTGLDEMTGDLLRKAGLQRPPTNVSFENSPWKADDAAWFIRHPRRSHRMRRMYKGEASSLSKDVVLGAPPEKYRYEILVRQVEVGRRVRTVFCRNTEVPIPDEEEVVHAIFDIVAQSGKTGVITSDEVEVLAAKYGVSIFTNPH